MNAITELTIDYSGYVRTEDQGYYTSIKILGNTPTFLFDLQPNAKPISIPGISGDFFYVEGIEEGEWGDAPYCTISEGLTGAKLHTDFELDGAIACIQLILVQRGIAPFYAMMKRLGDNISPRYQKIARK